MKPGSPSRRAPDSENADAGDGSWSEAFELPELHEPDVAGPVHAAI